jgi:hypothetical protein
MSDGNNHEARISVLETEVKAMIAGQRDVWATLEKLRSCLLTSVAAIQKDISATKLWMMAGVLGVVLPMAAYMFTKLMGWH